jgi:hypothetical protein
VYGRRRALTGQLGIGYAWSRVALQSPRITVTPEELADMHPRLYHVTSPEAWPGIRRHGLLPTSSLLRLFEIPEVERLAIERRRRPESVLLTHPIHGEATITDNYPLHERKLAACLDDGLTPADWLEVLNQRVFFWSDVQSVDDLLHARLNRVRDRLVLVFDTLGVARRHGPRMELSPINSGSTLYQPARRGKATFVPLLRHDYATFRRLRNMTKPDRIREVAIVGGIDTVDGLLIDHYVARGRVS